MADKGESVDRHYGVGSILESILGALTAMGKDVANLEPSDLAPVDEFHIRGRESTLELADRADIRPGMKVLDVGCGLGGSVRFLAAERDCLATGVELTQEYVDVSISLAKLVGFEGKVDFRQGSALDLPFDDETFDLVWTEHAQMNIEDKGRFYSEISRVLKPGGRLAFHDIFEGEGGEVHFPVPWAGDGSINFLVSLESIKKLVEESGLKIQKWEDKTGHSGEWFAAVVKKVEESGPPPLGIHLLMGDSALAKLRNMARNLRENRVSVIQAVAEKN